MGRLIDLTGQRFGRLAVIERAENSRDGQAKWTCACDCGKQIVVRGDILRSGRTSSCGCLKIERTSKANKKHNTFRTSGGVVYVKLSNSKNEMLVDPDVWKMAKQYCWGESNGYAVTTATEDAGKSRKRLLFHIFAFPDCPAGMLRDHINGNKLDNRRANIRFVTMSQSNQNRGVDKRNRSGYTGVQRNKGRNKWIARIQVNGKNIVLGRFDDIKDAIEARKQAEIKYFGEYRRKQQPETD